jgi:hypothetical protein
VADPVVKRGWVVGIVVTIGVVAATTWLTIHVVDQRPPSLPCADQLKVDE